MRYNQRSPGFQVTVLVPLLALAPVLALTLAACTSPPADSPAGDTGTDAPAACDTGGLAPQPADDYLSDYPPVVVRTVPQSGDQAVDPNLPEISVTFSTDMKDRQWSWVQVSSRTYPETGDPTYTDARTNVLPVTLQPDHTYVVWINYDPYLNFEGVNGQAAVPYQIDFHTAAE